MLLVNMLCKLLCKSLSICLLAIALCPSAFADAGAGFFVTRDGYFVTSHRAVINAGSTTIVIRDKFGGQFAAVVVATDAANDLALLKAKGSFTAIPIAKSGTVRTGDMVLATVSRDGGTGLVNAVVSSLTGLQGAPNIFGIAMLPASSRYGGPLLTTEGNVIGVMTSPRRPRLVQAANRGLTEDTAFAVKSDYLLALLATEKAAWRQLQPLNMVTPSTHGQVANKVGRSLAVVLFNTPNIPSSIQHSNTHSAVTSASTVVVRPAQGAIILSLSRG